MKGEYNNGVGNGEVKEMHLIKSRERVKNFAEVFTPKHIVEDMCDLLPEESFKPSVTFLEPAAGEGAMVLVILERKFKNCKCRKDFTTALKSVYAMELQADNVNILIRNIIELCNKYFKPSAKDIEIINDHCIQCDSLKVMKLLEVMQTE